MTRVNELGLCNKVQGLWSLPKKYSKYRVFSCDVMVAILLSLIKGTAVMLVFLTNRLGIELYYHTVLSFLLFRGKVRLLIR